MCMSGHIKGGKMKPIRLYIVAMGLAASMGAVLLAAVVLVLILGLQWLWGRGEKP